MIRLHGAPALSEFRTEKLLAQLVDSAGTQGFKCVINLWAKIESSSIIRYSELATCFGPSSVRHYFSLVE